MRILLLNQFFYPDSAATSQILTDLARELVAYGNDVTTVCAKSSYAPANTTSPPPVKIIRSKAPTFSHSSAGRMASYAGYLVTALLHGILMRPKPDIVLTLTTPPLLPIVGTFIKRMTQCRHFIWEMDLYPDVAVDLHVFGARSLAAKFSGILADYSRRNADGIIVLGDDMLERLGGRAIDPAKIHVVHNWADRFEIQPKEFPPLPLTAHYSGNLGLAHETETIQRAMLDLSANDGVRFIFAGGGPRRRALEIFCKQNALKQVSFQPYCGREALSDSLGSGHLGLVTQKPETIGSIVPSKVYGIMAAGRPVLYIGPRKGTPARIIEKFGCGWHIETGDPKGLVRLLERLIGRPDEIRKAGERARRALVDNFDRRLGTAKVAAIMGAAKSKTAATA